MNERLTCVVTPVACGAALATGATGLPAFAGLRLVNAAIPASCIGIFRLPPLIGLVVWLD
jgi:hypothetical protein